MLLVQKGSEKPTMEKTHEEVQVTKHFSYLGHKASLLYDRVQWFVDLEMQPIQSTDIQRCTPGVRVFMEGRS